MDPTTPVDAVNEDLIRELMQSLEGKIKSLNEAITDHNTTTKAGREPQRKSLVVHNRQLMEREQKLILELVLTSSARKDVKRKFDEMVRTISGSLSGRKELRDLHIRHYRKLPSQSGTRKSKK